MSLEYCYPLKEGEVLNEEHKEWELFDVTIHGSDRERIKLSKRLVCSLKHLPLRFRIKYEKDTEKSIEKGVGSDPTLEYDGKLIAEGLVSAERLSEIFQELLKRRSMSSEISFDEYLKSFDYGERKAMKIQIPELLKLYQEGKAEVIDIRFPDEYEAWHIGIGINIPLNELPNRLDEIDKSKTIVTVCPHYDRAEIARLYLKLKGYEARYLTDGLLGLVDFLRGDKARDFMQSIKK